MDIELDPERRLALAYVPAPLRQAVDTLWRLDATFAAVLVTGNEPMISRIRLAWWRESLEKLDRAGPPAEPMLQAVAANLLPLGLSGTELADMEEGWAALVAPDPLGDEELDRFARGRGGRLFQLSAKLLGGDEKAVESGGECWALVDFARHAGSKAEAEQALEAARRRTDRGRWPARERPLGMLAALARRDAAAASGPERQGSPRRVLRMIRHRLTGR